MCRSRKLEPGTCQAITVSISSGKPHPFNNVGVVYYRPEENADVKIVAVDLQLMAPLKGVVQIHGDITKVT